MYTIKIDGIEAINSNIDIVNSEFVDLKTLLDVYNLFHQVIFIDGFSTTIIYELLNNRHDIQIYYKNRNIAEYIEGFFDYVYNKNEIEEIENDIKREEFISKFLENNNLAISSDGTICDILDVQDGIIKIFKCGEDELSTYDEQETRIKSLVRELII